MTLDEMIATLVDLRELRGGQVRMDIETCCDNVWVEQVRIYDDAISIRGGFDR